MIPKSSRRIPVAEGESPESVDPVRQERVRDLFLSLEKAMKLMRLYDASNKNYLTGVHNLTGKFAAYLEEAGELEAAVTADGFVALDELHLKSAKREASVPYRLYRDGVRKLRFLQGLERDELMRLLKAFETQPDSPGRFDEDMVTILWRENFHQIEVVSVDEIDLSANRPAGTGETGGFASDLSGKLETMMESLKTSLFAGTEGKEGASPLAAGDLDLLEMRRLGKSSARSENEGNDFKVSEATVAKLRGELEADGSGGLVRRAVDVFAHVFFVGPCNLAPNEALDILGHFLQEMLGRADVSGVNEVLDRIAGSTHHAADLARDLLGGLLGKLAAEDSMALILIAARSSTKSDAQPFLRLLTRLPATALRVLARQMRDLEAGPVKDAWHQILVSRGGEDPPALFAYLEHEGGERAVEAVRAVLASKKVPRAETLLRNLLSHQEERVRADALKACTALPRVLRRGLFETGLADTSQRVRFAALRAVEISRDPGFMPVLAKRLEECGESEEEPVRLVHAIAALGGDGAADYLRKFLIPRRRWLPFGLGFRRGPRWRRAAIVGLQDVADRSVLDLLAEGAASSDRSVADACRMCLARVESRRRIER